MGNKSQTFSGMVFGIIAIGYLCVALFTFGHAYNTPKHRMFDDPMGRFFVALPSAALWPLYWSVKLQEHTP